MKDNYTGSVSEKLDYETMEARVKEREEDELYWKRKGAHEMRSEDIEFMVQSLRTELNKILCKIMSDQKSYFQTRNTGDSLIYEFVRYTTIGIPMDHLLRLYHDTLEKIYSLQ